MLKTERSLLRSVAACIFLAGFFTALFLPVSDAHARTSLSQLLKRIEALETNNAELQDRVANLEAKNAELQNRVEELESSGLSSRVSELENDVSDLWPLAALVPYVSVVSGQINNVAGPHVMFEGVNVHVRSGSGATDGVINGLGNLIVGYNGLTPSNNTVDRSGSHNLVVGRGNGFSSYGGLIAGCDNIISGLYASVTGGGNNEASGPISSVTGGSNNQASAPGSSVSGGDANIASQYRSSVSGGSKNIAGGLFSSVTGGFRNEASGFSSSVTGGYLNEARGKMSTVLGWNEVIAWGSVNYGLYPYPLGVGYTR